MRYRVPPSNPSLCLISPICMRTQVPQNYTKSDTSFYTWLREISSLPYLTVVPGPVWALLSKACIPVFLPLYSRRSMGNFRSFSLAYCMNATVKKNAQTTFPSHSGPSRATNLAISHSVADDMNPDPPILESFKVLSYSRQVSAF